MWYGTPETDRQSGGCLQLQDHLFLNQIRMKTTPIWKGAGATVNAITHKKESVNRGSSKAENSLLWSSLISFRCSFSIACIITCLAFSHQAQAQQRVQSPASKHQFRVGIGVDYIKTVDLQYSPNLYQSLRKSLQLSYANRSKKGLFLANLDVYYGALTPNAGSVAKLYAKETDIYGHEAIESLDVATTQLGGNLEIGYLRGLTKSATSRTAFYAGGSVQENLTFAAGVLGIGTINFVSLNAKARVDYTLGNGRPLRFGLTFPALSVVTRLPYHSAPAIPGKSDIGAFFTGNNTVETARHFQNAQLSIMYNWLVRKRVSFDITGQSSWLHYYKPEHLTQAGSQISLGLTF